MSDTSKLFDILADKVRIAIERLKTFEPPEGYYLAFSGGKDSVCIKALADMAGVKYDAHYNLTTIDPPELVRFIYDKHSDVVVERPEVPFLKMMIKKGFPTRLSRWCCYVYKERGGEGRIVITGVRWAESPRRAANCAPAEDWGATKEQKMLYSDQDEDRRLFQSCRIRNKKVVNPIIDWTDEDVWEFIRRNKLPYCKLYDEGFKRIGCLLCPMAGKQRMEEVRRYPKFVLLFLKAFEELHRDRKARGLASVNRWSTGEEMFNWWIENDRKPVSGEEAQDAGK